MQSASVLRVINDYVVSLMGTPFCRCIPVSFMSIVLSSAPFANITVYVYNHVLRGRCSGSDVSENVGV